jgi:hypothetical protein
VVLRPPVVEWGLDPIIGLGESESSHDPRVGIGTASSDRPRPEDRPARACPPPGPMPAGPPGRHPSPTRPSPAGSARGVSQRAARRPHRRTCTTLTLRSIPRKSRGPICIRQIPGHDSNWVVLAPADPSIRSHESPGVGIRLGRRSGSQPDSSRTVRLFRLRRPCFARNPRAPLAQSMQSMQSMGIERGTGADAAHETPVCGSCAPCAPCAAWALNGAPAPMVGTRPRCVARARHATHATHGRPIGLAATSGAPPRPPLGCGFPPTSEPDLRSRRRPTSHRSPSGGATWGDCAGRSGGSPSKTCHILPLRAPELGANRIRANPSVRRSGPLGPGSRTDGMTSRPDRNAGAWVRG